MQGKNWKIISTSNSKEAYMNNMVEKAEASIQSMWRDSYAEKQSDRFRMAG